MFVTKGVSTGIILAFFAGIIFLLRFLYGPKGKFRDPKWDEWNEQARLALEEELGEKAAKIMVQPFMRYAQTFFSGNAAQDVHLQLKVDHTMRVFAHAKKIAREEAAFADPQMARMLLLAALYHDVGRFAQFTKYQTFSDAHSCNHGVLGARIIRQQGFLADEPRIVEQTVLTAVAAHNRFQVPPAVAGKLRDVLCAVRDADKLDIVRIMEENLGPGRQADAVVLMHLKDEPLSFSPVILEALQAGKGALYRDMRYANDFRLLLCSWLYELHFAASFRIVKREKYLDRILDSLEALPEVQKIARGIVQQKLENV